MARYVVPCMRWTDFSVTAESDTATCHPLERKRYAKIYINASTNDTTTWRRTYTTAGDSNDTYEFWIYGDPRPHYIQNGEHWTRQYSRLPHSHKVEDFIYMPGEEEPGLGLTQRLAPIEEMIEVDGVTRVIEHFAKLLQDPEYRKQQVDYLNKVNKEIGAMEVTYDEDAVLFKIQRMFGTYMSQACQMLAEQIGIGFNTITEWLKNVSTDVISEKMRQYEVQRKQLEKVRLANARMLLESVLTPTELISLRDNKRILVSRLGETYEILNTGKVNKLLPNGEKKGLCIISRLCNLPVEDIIAMKKLLLVSNPIMFEQVANKTSPFQPN